MFSPSAGGGENNHACSPAAGSSISKCPSEFPWGLAASSPAQLFGAPHLVFLAPVAAVVAVPRLGGLKETCMSPTKATLMENAPSVIRLSDENAALKTEDN